MRPYLLQESSLSISRVKKNNKQLFYIFIFSFTYHVPFPSLPYSHRLPIWLKYKDEVKSVFHELNNSFGNQANYFCIMIWLWFISCTYARCYIIVIYKFFSQVFNLNTPYLLLDVCSHPALKMQLLSTHCSLYLIILTKPTWKLSSNTLDYYVNPLMFKSSSESDVLISDTFDHILGIRNGFAKYLKERCR